MELYTDTKPRNITTRNSPGILDLYNNNIWSVYYELGEVYNTLENLEQINKNLGGEAVKI